MRARVAILIFVLAVVGSSSPAWATETETSESDANKQEFPVVISLLQEAVDLPFIGHNVFTGPLHPGMAVGTEYEYVQGRYGRLFQTAELGFFYHGSLDTVAFARTEFAYGHGFDFGLGFEALLGVGYGQAFLNQPVYSLETGEETTDWGKPAFLASLALGVEYDFRAQDLLPASVFVRYQPVLQIHASAPSEIPQIPRTIVMIGTKFHFDKGGK